MKTNTDNYVVNDEYLGNVSGGALKSTAYNDLDGYISLYKRCGYTKNELKMFLKGIWGNHNQDFSTNGHQEDLDALLKYVDLHW